MSKKWPSVAAQIKTTWHVLCSLWASIRRFDQNSHNAIHERHPVITRLLGGLLRVIYGGLTAPAFGIFLAFVLVGFVISGVVTIIVSLSAWCAWLVTVLAIARLNVICRLNILPRLLVVAAFAIVSAFVANRYVEWCLTKYTESHPLVTHKEDSPKSDADDLVYQRLRGLFQEESTKAAHNEKAKNAPSISTTLLIPPASSGNLKERALSLANELNGFAKYRESVLQDRYAAELKPGESKWLVYKSWNESTTGIYEQRYEQRVIGVVSELAALHLRDKMLDEDLEVIQEMEHVAQLTGDRTPASVGLFQLRDISERIANLAGLIPQNP